MKHKISIFSLTLFSSFTLAACSFVKEETVPNYREILYGDDSINPTAIKIDKEKLSLHIGDKETLAIEFTPAKCNKALKWTSDAPGVVGVDDVGNIVAKKVGKAIISAKTINNIVAQCEVEVEDTTVTSITLDVTEIDMDINTTYSIGDYKVEPSNSKPNIKYEVSSNSQGIISVDEYGKITALKSGQGVVYIYDDNNNNGMFNQNSEVFASVIVNVIEKVGVEITNTVNAPFFPTQKNVSLTNLTNPTTIPIVTFNMTQSIPYIEGGSLDTMYKNFFKASYNIELNSSSFYKTYTDYFAYESTGGSVRFYTDDNTIVLHDWHKFVSMFYSTNNGYPLDICQPSTNSMVNGSTKTKTIQNHTSDVSIQLSDYSLRIIKYNDKLYIPFEVASTFIFHNIANFVFDGAKIFNPYECLDYKKTIPFFFSSKNAFSFYDDNIGLMTFVKTTSSSGTIYRTENKDDFGYYINGQFTFNSDKTGSYVLGYNNTGSFTEFTRTFNSFNFTYTESSNIINIKLENSSNVDYYVNTSNSNFASNQFLSGYKDYAYYALCLKLDYFYGLKHKLSSESFTEFFKSAELSLYKKSLTGSGQGLLKKDTIYNLYRSAQDVNEVSEIVSNFFSYYLGDGHTGFKIPSVFGTLSGYIMNVSTSNNTSARINNLRNSLSNLKAKKTAALNLDSNATLPNDVLTNSDSSMAILQFSKFAGNTIPKGTSYTSFKDQSDLVYTDKINTENFKTIAKQLAIFSESSTMKNIVFDTTLNGGGQVRLVPQLLAFMTSDPTIVVRSTITGGVTEYHYAVDLNGDGTYGGADDNLADKFKFYILQSSYSFSSANAFSACAKLTGAATLIGDQRSGGGSCIVSYGNDAFGNTFELSGTLEIMRSNNQGGFVSDDDGAEADKVIDREYFYKPNALYSVLPSPKV